MLTVHRKKTDLFLLHEWDDEMPRSDKSLLVCQGNVLSCLNSCHRRADSDHAHHCRHEDFISFHDRNLQKSFHAGDDLRACIFHTDSQLFCLLLVPDTADLRGEFTNLAFQCIDVSSRRDSHNFNISVCTDYIQSLGSDGTCGTQNSNSFHLFVLF